MNSDIPYPTEKKMSMMDRKVKMHKINHDIKYKAKIADIWNKKESAEKAFLKIQRHRLKARRSMTDRRCFDYAVHIPEKRHEKDRRKHV